VVRSKDENRRLYESAHARDEAPEVTSGRYCSHDDLIQGECEKGKDTGSNGSAEVCSALGGFVGGALGTAFGTPLVGAAAAAAGGEAGGKACGG
jgi:outer membrane lipoprotein SlyB